MHRLFLFAKIAHATLIKTIMTQEEQDEINKLLEESGKHYANKDYEKAIEYCDKVIAINPNISNAYNNKALALDELKKHEEAIEIYNQAIKLKPNSPNFHTNKGNALAKQGKYEEALKNYDKAIKLDTDYIKAYNNKGIALFYQKKYKEAIEVYNKVIELDPNNAVPYSNKGLVLSELGKHEEAIQTYNTAIKLYKNNNDDKGKAYHNKGISLNELGKHEEAIKNYDKAIRLIPKHTGTYGNKGNSLYDLGRYQEAIEQYNKVLDLDPKDIKASRNLGYTYLALGKWEKTGENFGKAKIEILDSISILEGKEHISEVTQNLLKYQPENYFWKVLERTGVCKASDRPCPQHTKSCENCELKNKCHAYMQIYVQSLQIISHLQVNDPIEDKVAHYTTKDSTHILLLNRDKNEEAAKLRLASIARANDPKEGQILSEYLFNNTENSITNTKQSDYQAFISCFTFNHQSLNQFRLYGKEKGKEASGVSIVMKSSFFSPKLELTQNMKFASFSDDKKDTQSNPINNKLPLFRCIYVDPETEAVISLGHKELYAYIREEIEKDASKRARNLKKQYNKYIQKRINVRLTEVTKGFNQLKKLVSDNNLDKTTINELLLMLSYLVKHVAFKEEQECRILEIASLINQEENNLLVESEIENGNYRMYINYLPITEDVDRLYMGNQFEDFGLFRDIIKHKCGIDSYLCNHPFAIT